MPYADLKEFLDTLSKEEELVRVKKKVDSKYEIGDVCRKVQDMDGPAVLFENVRGYPGWRVVCGVLGTFKRVAMALEISGGPGSVIQEYIRRVRGTPIEPEIVSNKEAPCKEVVIKDPDLAKIPIPIWHLNDAGPYISFSLQITKSPETGARDAGIIRQQVTGSRESSLQLLPNKNITKSYLKKEEKGEPLEIAIATGLEPIVNLIGSYPGLYGEYGDDDFAVAGAVRGEPVKLVKCETIDVEVPATAEVVIEGRMLPKERTKEGPFGDCLGYYSENEEMPIMEVTCITHRKNPIWQGTCEGRPPSESATVRSANYSAGTYIEASKTCPYLTALYAPPMGCALVSFIGSIKKTNHDQAREAMKAIWNTKMGRFIKKLIIVDEGVNIYDPKEVEYVVATNTRPEKDVIIFPMPGVPGPSTRLGNAGLGIDATQKLPEEGVSKQIPIDHSESAYFRQMEKLGIEKYLNIMLPALE